jgi:hypothetical protein
MNREALLRSLSGLVAGLGLGVEQGMPGNTSHGRGRQDKGAAIGRPQVVGWIELFCHHVPPPCWRCPILSRTSPIAAASTVFMKVAHLAEAPNLPVTSHSAHDITVHLFAACPNRSYLETHA